MNVLDGATIFWLITLGMLAGSIVKLTMWRTTVGFAKNLLAGIAGTLIVGGLTIKLQLPGGMLFALLGGTAILFILNVFHLQPKSVH